ncbi:hypothetical protein GCM10027290_43810 [Micromonospora sonneratiae]|uniref:Protein phosphatase 2C n=1 Tax=Micromonospora sonneratiae TaxID=1184706 RepID=A0ABW3Y6R4_9ACTN
MQVQIASEPAPERPANEDAALHVGSLVGVFDGVTAPEGIDCGCIHSPAWYVQRLTRRLAEVAEECPNTELPDMLAQAIERVRGDHGNRCDLDNPATPAATVCLIRANAGQMDYLLLADCTLVVDQGGNAVTALTDERFATAVAGLRREALATHGIEQLAGRSVRGKYELTNQPHGYWIAAANPEAAHRAVTGTLDLLGPARIRRAALLTDGVSCIVEKYSLMEWWQLLDALTEKGPHELIRYLRQVETSDPVGAKHPRYKRHDDATAALCVFEEHS